MNFGAVRYSESAHDQLQLYFSKQVMAVIIKINFLASRIFSTALWNYLYRVNTVAFCLAFTAWP